MYIYIYIYVYVIYTTETEKYVYIYTTEFMLCILPQTSTIDLILRTVLPIFMQPEAIIYTPLYKHRGHLLSTYAEFSEKLTFLSPLYAHVRLRIRGVEMLAFRKILHTYIMDGPIVFS